MFYSYLLKYYGYYYILMKRCFFKQKGVVQWKSFGFFYY